MSRLPIPTRDEAPAASQPILDAVGAQLGLIPNMFKVIGLSPKALEAFTGFSGGVAKLDETEIALARTSHSADARADAAVTFARKLAETRGQVSDADIAAVKLAGFSDAQLVEIVLVTVENFLTNFVNNVARTTIDFPEVRAKAA